MDSTSYIYKFIGFELDPSNNTLSFQGAMIDVPEKSFQFLEKLLAADHKVVEKYHLLDELWKGLVVSEWSLSRLVSDTRHLLAIYVSEQDIIQTLRGKGFRIHPNVVVEKVDYLASPPAVERRAPLLASQSKSKRSNYAIVGLVLSSILVLSMWWFNAFESASNLKSSNIVQSDVETTKVDDHTSTDLLTILPVQILTGDDQDNWAEYGVMTMVIEELQRFPDIKVANMSSTLSNLSNVKIDYKHPALFEHVCPALGCKNLLLMNLTLSKDKLPNLSYQLISADKETSHFSFIDENILVASNMLLEHLLQSLLPSSPERMTLSHTYTNNSVANQDYAIGVSRVYHGEFQSARDYLDLALKREPTFMWAKIYQIEILYREGKLHKAEQDTQALMQQALDIRQSIFLQNLLSNIAYSQGDLAKSIDIANGFLDAVEQTEDKDLFGATHMNIGTSYQSLGNIEKGLEHLQIALDTFQQHGFKLREAQALLNLGNTVWVGNSDYELSNDYYQKSAEIFRQLGAQNYLVYAKHMAAGVNISSKRYLIAKRELNEVIKLYEKLADKEGVLIAQADLTVVALKENNLVEAEKLGLAVYADSAEEYTYPRSIISAYLAITYLNLNQLPKALLYIEERNKYDWFDPRPAYAMIPASYAHARGDYQQAVDISIKLKKRLGEQWNIGHQTYSDIFLYDLKHSKSSIKDYANLYKKIN